ncbi:MAG: hypothetical protein WCK84_10225 [Bacteroidota bacterium]
MNKKEVTNPTVPRQASFPNFVQGDSLKLDINFLTVNGQTYTYSSEITVNQVSVGIMDRSETNHAGEKLVHDQLTFKISQ